VRVVRVGTVLERMSYDKDVYVVRAGKPVEIVFANDDMMPHNLVIVQPGALEETGMLAESLAQNVEHQKRDYVPQSKQILLKSKLLQPRDVQKLSFTAPKKAGVYPIVCTYPGHWRRMYAALYVVDDLDGYLAAPEAYLASNPLEIKDALLADRRPRTEWKYDDLAEAMKTLDSGRSYGTGKQLFQAAACIACHKLDNVGNAFGPDLTKLDPKWGPTDILKELLDPSARINEKFQTFAFVLASGKVVTGLVIEETPDALTVVENPLAKSPPVKIMKADIEEQTKQPASIMPKGLLDKLSRDEIMDLVAFLTSRGDKGHAVFRGGHH
jgi:putative heme-binding domain-containing protein